MVVVLNFLLLALFWSRFPTSCVWNPGVPNCYWRSIFRGFCLTSSVLQRTDLLTIAQTHQLADSAQQMLHVLGLLGHPEFHRRQRCANLPHPFRQLLSKSSGFWVEGLGLRVRVSHCSPMTSKEPMQTWMPEFALGVNITSGAVVGETCLLHNSGLPSLEANLKEHHKSPFEGIIKGSFMLVWGRVLYTCTRCGREIPECWQMLVRELLETGVPARIEEESQEDYETSLTA